MCRITKGVDTYLVNDHIAVVADHDFRQQVDLSSIITASVRSKHRSGNSSHHIAVVADHDFRQQDDLSFIITASVRCAGSPRASTLTS